jgi:5-dehydro-4-deoxyglucarate dehydratase
MNPQELKYTLSSGLLSFPITDFDSSGDFLPATYTQRLDWLMAHKPKALFAAGALGEFFSLTQQEFVEVIRTAVDACGRKTPIIAAAGGPTRVAIAYAQEAERLQAQGVLLLPHYLTEASQEGLAAHVEAVCRSVSLGVIVYNRGLCRLNTVVLEQLADRCHNLVGFKDGIGDIELIVSIRRRLGERLAYVCGMSAAELYAMPYKALGVPVYSSAIFNFIPKTAMTFYNAVASDDHATVGRLIDEFFLPYLEIRNRRAGYAVSIVKAGARLVGHDAGPVRPPLVDLRPDETELLQSLIKAVDAC